MLKKILIQKKDSGMTLLEIMIVVSILAVMMTYLATNLTKTQDSAMIDTAKMGMQQIMQPLQMYKLHNKTYPNDQQGLDALVTNPGNAKSWRGPYIEKSKLKDPWDNSFRYSLENGNPKLYSNGPDGQEGTEDDIEFPEAEE